MIKQKLLLLGFAILGIGGFIYYKQSSQVRNQIINFIPDNTLVLLETNEISTVKNAVIPRIPLLTNASSQYQILKSIGLSQKDIEELILNKTLYFALLPEGKDDLAFVNYLPLNTDNEDFIEKLNSLNQNNTGKRIIPHTTKGHKVLEVIDENAKVLFAFIIQSDYLIFSKSNLALEESILHTENNWIKTLKFHHNDEKDNLIFTQTHFNNLAISNFIEDVSTKKIANFAAIFPESLKWLKPTFKSIEAISTTPNSDLFNEQKSLAIQSSNMIPNSCSYSLIMSFSNQEKLTNNLENILKNNEKINLLREKVNSKFEIEFGDIYNKINREVTLCSFDNSEQDTQNKVLIIKQEGLLKVLKLISNNVARNSGNDVFSTQYGSYSMISLGIKEFPMMLFGETYTGFEECYFTQFKDYVIMASNVSVMQEYLVSISKGEVWGNSPKHKKILAHCLPANLTLVMENAKALIGIQKILNNRWISKMKTYEKAFKDVEAEILQVNSTDSRLILIKSINITKSVQKLTQKWIKLDGVNVSSISKPLFLINPQNKRVQILCQTSDYRLNLYENGKRLWNYQLGNKILGEIKSVSYSKANSQELTVITKSKMYILTRTETGFDVIESKVFSELSLESYNVFMNETDKEKNLTFVSEKGNIYKLNKETLKLSATFTHKDARQGVVPMSNIILKGIEYVVILEKTGKLILQNAKGNISKGFPMTINGIFFTPPSLEKEDNGVVFRMINEQGVLYKISSEGKILEKRQLFRPDNEVKFSMSVNERSTDWVLTRTNGKEVVILDKNEEELFAIRNLSYGKKIVGYYDLGIAGKYFSVNNGYENYQFFDENGGSIGQIPIESQFKPTLSYSDSYKKIIMNVTKPSTLETWSVKIR